MLDDTQILQDLVSRLYQGGTDLDVEAIHGFMRDRKHGYTVHLHP